MAAKCSIFVLILFSQCARYMGANFISLVTPSNCKSGATDLKHQFYDISKLECVDCKENSTLQVSSTDKLKCVCRNGFKYSKNYGGSDVMCEACTVGKVSSNSRWECSLCADNFIVATKQCKTCNTDPASREVEVERELNGAWYTNSLSQPARTCLPCVAGTRPSADGTRCERCSQILSVLPSNTDCTCPATQLAGGVCFKNTDDLILPNAASTVQTDLSPMATGGQAVNSAFISEHLLAAYAMCKPAYGNFSACQVLSSMCVMSMYYKSGSASKPDACALYINIAGTDEWPANMPWLYYSEDTTADRTLEDNKISTQYTFTTSSDNSKLKFKVAKYSLHGAFLGLQDVTGGTLQLCSDTPTRLNAAYTFGVQYSQTCTVALSELWDEQKNPLIFYDMYLEFQSSGQTELYAVPVLNRNIDSNTESDQKLWKLTRRFFVVDNIAFKTKNVDGTLSQARYVRYASSIRIVIQLQKDSKDGKIYPPYIDITYKDASEADFTAGKSVSIDFSVSYSMDQTSYNSDISIAMGVLGALGVVYGGIKSWAWSKRAGKQTACDFVTLIKFVLFCCGTISNVFFTVMLGSSFWWIVFYKRQDIVFLVPETVDQQTGFVAFLSVAFALKCIEMIHMFAVQTTVDIFFIDWERPRPTFSTKDGEKSQEAPVSIWRTYFIANEWNEIQSCRKINPILQLFATVFFLSVVGFQNLASGDPYSNFSIDTSQYRSEDSRVFRFAVGACAFLIIGIVQWIFHTLIYERFICDPVREFVDLCSMANISVFIMETAQYGFYIHGRSVHGRADTDMRVMYTQLKREEENLVGNRGLLPNTEQQTFRMALPKRLRVQYDRVLTTLNTQRAQPTARMERGQGGKPDSFENSLQAYAVINRFLSAFIDHSLRDLDYMVKDKLLFESILDAEFEEISEKGRFYNDSGHSFDAVLFYGNESTLMIFDILLFSIVDLMAQNFVLAGCITYLVDMILVKIRDAGGEKNLAKKTLVDERFLI